MKPTGRCQKCSFMNDHLRHQLKSVPPKKQLYSRNEHVYRLLQKKSLNISLKAICIFFSSTLISKYGHFWLKFLKTRWQQPKYQSQSLKTVLHTKVGDVTLVLYFLISRILISTSLIKLNSSAANSPSCFKDIQVNRCAERNCLLFIRFGTCVFLYYAGLRCHERKTDWATGKTIFHKNQDAEEPVMLLLSCKDTDDK